MKLPLSYWDIVAKVCQFSFTDLNICTILFPISYGTNKTQKDYSLQESVLLACHKNAISSKAFRRCHFVTSFEAESFCPHHEREGSSFCRNLTFANSQKWPHTPWTLFPSGTNHINTFLCHWSGHTFTLARGWGTFSIQIILVIINGFVSYWKTRGRVKIPWLNPENNFLLIPRCCC